MAKKLGAKNESGITIAPSNIAATPIIKNALEPLVFSKKAQPLVLKI